MSGTFWQQVASNPVGTEQAPQQTMQSSAGTPFDPLVGFGSSGQPIMLSHILAAHQVIQQAMQLAPTMVLGMAGSIKSGEPPVTRPQPPAPARISGPMPSDPGYVYHVTNAERLQDIADTGKLLTHKPYEFTDQDVWPDGSTQKRNYFTPSAQNTWQFAPEEGHPALLRMLQNSHPVQAERGTGDLYSTKPVPATNLEYLGDNGAWHPVSGLKQ